jgi:hypothetical protein
VRRNVALVAEMVGVLLDEIFHSLQMHHTIGMPGLK